MTERFAFLGVKRFRILLALYSSLGLCNVSVMRAITFLYGRTVLMKK